MKLRVVCVVPAVAVVLALFWVLQSMIRVAAAPPALHRPLHLVDFVRVDKERPLVKKKRFKPEKPTPAKQPVKPKIHVQQSLQMEKMPLLQANIDLDVPIDLSAVSVLGDAPVAAPGGREISTNVLPLATIPPVYPRRARMMRKEGYVKLEFTITIFGTVKDVEIVESSPPRLFDTSAKNALLRWKFKPKANGKQAVEQRAVIQIDYRLDS
jgi:protein TonB